LAILAYENGIVLIDEIDNGLHHSVQESLWKAIFAWANKYKVQIFATTHSDECVKAFAKCSQGSLFAEEAKLYRIEREDDKFRAVEYTTEVLAESLDSNWEIR